MVWKGRKRQAPKVIISIAIFNYDIKVMNKREGDVLLFKITMYLIVSFCNKVSPYGFL